jgi:putative transposase
MKKTKSLYHGHRFPASVISCAVRWYFRFNLSLRDIEELLLKRGVVVNYETIRCWCDKFGAAFAGRAKAVRRKPGSTWHLDEVFVKLRGEPYVLWGQWMYAAPSWMCFCRSARIRTQPNAFQACAAIESGAPENRHRPTAQLPCGEGRHRRTRERQACVREGGCTGEYRAENSHQPTRRRERDMNGFRDPLRT